MTYIFSLELTKRSPTFLRTNYNSNYKNWIKNHDDVSNRGVTDKNTFCRDFNLISVHLFRTGRGKSIDV